MDYIAASAGVGAGLVYLLQRALRNNQRNRFRRSFQHADTYDNYEEIEAYNVIGDGLPLRHEYALLEAQDEGVFDAEEEGFRVPSEGEGDSHVPIRALRAVPAPYVRVIPLNLYGDDAPRNYSRTSFFGNPENERVPPKRRNIFTHTNPDFIVFYPL